MTNRVGDWMQTATGRQFWPLDPRPEEVHLEDIAAALSKICRYGGHCKRFYSVAEHSVLMARALPEALRKYALLHDASEAYLNDVIRPLKRFIPGYCAIEHKVMVAVCDRFKVEYPMPAAIKEADNNIILDEHVQMMAGGPAWDKPEWEIGRVPLGVTIEGWLPQRACAEFLSAWCEA